MQYLLVALALLALAIYLVIRARRENRRRLEPYRPTALAEPFDVEAAYRFVRGRISSCATLSPDQLRDLLRWCSEYVRAHVAPMNGGGPRDGWLMPPNMFETVEHVQRRAEEEGVSVPDECLWEIVGVHDEYLRR